MMTCVDLFIPCYVDQFYPETALNMVKLLKRAGVTVDYNTNQTCCGSFAYHAGYLDEAKALGDKFLDDFSNDRPVVAPTASCVAYVKNHFEELFFNTSNHLNFKRLIGNIYELSDFLVNKLNFDDFGAKFPHKVTYHDSCSAIRGLGLGPEARQLLSKVEGLELVEMQQRDQCCGSDLAFSVNHPVLSASLVSRKMRNAMETGAEYIVTNDMSCLMHQNLSLQGEHSLKVIHLADVLASGW